MGFSTLRVACGLPLYTQIKDLDKGARLPLRLRGMAIRQPES